MSDQVRALLASKLDARPEWNDHNVPCCSDRCPQYDGKRCDLLGFRPDRICEPMVVTMFEQLVIARSP